ncbi:MAG: hypothetical protein ABSF32_12085 [Ignavibacteria bacterium]|jgi:hypothetical protein
MPKGDIYYHLKFPFSDGTCGIKYFIVLFEPSNDKEPYIVAKTTSNLRGKSYSIGCNQNLKAFYVPQQNVQVFHSNTLIQLHELFEFSNLEFTNGVNQNLVIQYKQALPPILFSQLINCIKSIREDVSVKHYEMIMRK